MLFKDYLDAQNIKIKDAAKFIGCSYETARLYYFGKRAAPRHKVMEKIKELSKGQVTAADFHEAYINRLKTNQPDNN